MNNAAAKTSDLPSSKTFTSSYVEKFPFYKSLPKYARHRVHDIVSVKMFSESDEFPTNFPVESLDFYYILQGSIELFITNQPTICFTEYQSIDPKDLSSKGCVTVQQIKIRGFCKALIISSEDYFALTSRTNCFTEELSSFLLKKVPRLEKYSVRRQAEILSWFSLTRFPPGVVILTEGSVSQKVYLIYQGTCVLTAKQNKYLKEAIFSNEANELTNLSPYGLLSKTMIQCRLGTFSEGSWIGEDSAIIRIPLGYTVTSKTTIYALEMQARKFRLLPTEILSELGTKAKAKLEWAAERCSVLNKTNIDLLNDDLTNRVYQKSVTKIKERFPKANGNVLRNLRDLIFKQEETVNIGTLFKLANPYCKRTNSRNNVLPLLNKTGTERISSRHVSPLPIPTRDLSKGPYLPLLPSTTQNRCRSVLRK